MIIDINIFHAQKDSKTICLHVKLKHVFSITILISMTCRVTAGSHFTTTTSGQRVSTQYQHAIAIGHLHAFLRLWGFPCCNCWMKETVASVYLMVVHYLWWACKILLMGLWIHSGLYVHGLSLILEITWPLRILCTILYLIIYCCKNGIHVLYGWCILSYTSLQLCLNPCWLWISVLLPLGMAALLTIFCC